MAHGTGRTGGWTRFGCVSGRATYLGIAAVVLSTQYCAFSSVPSIYISCLLE